jgi:plasmid stabilization system protein ParE
VSSVRFHPEAEAELIAEARYYDEQSPGLGTRFILAVQAAIDLAANFPKIGIPYKHRTRRVFPRHFPFSVVYREQADGLVILAIAPFRRKPIYWRTREAST